MFSGICHIIGGLIGKSITRQRGLKRATFQGSWAKKCVGPEREGPIAYACPLCEDAVNVGTSEALSAKNNDRCKHEGFDLNGIDSRTRAHKGNQSATRKAPEHKATHISEHSSNKSETAKC
jgi:hypothetical protein